jgi:hypothetical protein
MEQIVNDRPSGLFQSVRRSDSDAAPEKRLYPRRECLKELNYKVRDRWYKGTVRNISDGGVYVHAGARFYRGAEIVLDFPSALLRGKVQGVIAWVGFRGMGVKFRNTESQDTTFGFRDREGVMNDIVLFPKKRVEMGRIRSRRVHWEPSSTANVEYRLYWSIGGGVDYHSDHADVGNVKEINLPNDISSFPLTWGKFELGISAINQAGNESELTKVSVSLDFSIPEAPRNLKVEEL